ncbi:MAG: c-type cytochrome domain-containing protein, partial [Planctomycetota bacterium]
MIPRTCELSPLGRRVVGPAAITLVLVFCLNASAETTAEPKVSFKNQVEPILRRNCYGCHQGAKQLGEYLMTDFASLVAGGETGESAIVPGKPDESYLFSQIELVDGVAEMPKPPAKPLKSDEVELIKRWILEGAIDDSIASEGPQFSPQNPPQYRGSPAVTSMDVSADGRWIAVAGYHEVLMLNTSDGAIAKRLIGLSPRINGVAFSPDGKQLAAVGGTPGIQGEVQIWSVESGELDLSVTSTYDALAGISWSPDAKKLAFGAADNTVRAIDAKTGEQVLFQGAHEDWIRDVAFTSDGAHLVSVARDMSCKLTEVETERFIDNITSITPGALSGGLNSIAMHPTRDEVVVGGADGVAKVYRIFRQTARKIGDDANLVRKLPAMEGRIFDVAINASATRIAAAATINGKSEIRVW